MPAAERINVYLPLIQKKRVGIFANQTSMVGNKHLVDTLRSLGVNIAVIFGPEHGFPRKRRCRRKSGELCRQGNGYTSGFALRFQKKTCS
jgi:uncharacterized protein YbbC (DUF1343 family)